MTTIVEALAALDREHKRRARPERTNKEAEDGKLKRFYKSRAWAKARYAYLKTLSRPLRCACCGATAKDERLVVDHVVSLRHDWSRRLDPTNFQVLCNTHNYVCKGSENDDWREIKRRRWLKQTRASRV